MRRVSQRLPGGSHASSSGSMVVLLIGTISPTCCARCVMISAPGSFMAPPEFKRRTLPARDACAGKVKRCPAGAVTISRFFVPELRLQLIRIKPRTGQE
jgi:hypothetical protein